MPLADVDVVVARRLQELRQGDLGGRHAHVRVGNRRLRLCNHALAQQARRRVAEQRNHRAEARGRRRELEAKAGAVAAGHQGGAGRGAGAVGRIAVGELHALVRQGIDVRRGHAAASDASALPTQVVPAKVVREDDDDVRRPLGFGSGGRVCTRVPINCLRRRNIAALPNLDDFEHQLKTVHPGNASQGREHHHATNHHARAPAHRHPLSVRPRTPTECNDIRHRRWSSSVTLARSCERMRARRSAVRLSERSTRSRAR